MTEDPRWETVEALLEAASLARAFHEAYERLAPHYDYETRRESAVEWVDVPDANKALMQATAMEVARPIFDQLFSLRSHTVSREVLEKLAGEWRDRAVRVTEGDDPALDIHAHLRRVRAQELSRCAYELQDSIARATLSPPTSSTLKDPKEQT